MFLEQLLEYTDIIGQVLAQEPNYNIQLEKIRSNDKNKALLGLYISKNSCSIPVYFRFSKYRSFRKSFGSAKSHIGQ